MNILENHPIEHQHATCFKMRTEDEEWTAIEGKVSKPIHLKRGSKVIRIFYPDDEALSPFLVSQYALELRRGTIWVAAEREKVDVLIIAQKFLKEAEEEGAKAARYIETLHHRIQFLTAEIVWARN